MSFLDTILADARYGVRILAKNPGFSAVAVLVLTLGIGANSAIFSLVNAILLRPLPIARAGELVGVYNRRTTAPGGYGYRSFSYPDYRDLRHATTGLANLAAFNVAFVGLEDEGLVRRVMAYSVSANYFATFGASFSLGRAFSPEEAAPGAQIRAAIVSHAYWETRNRDAGAFARPRSLVARALRI